MAWERGRRCGRWALYLLAIASASAVAGLVVWTVFLVPRLQNVGFSLRDAALITGGMGRFSWCCGSLRAGSVTRWGGRRVYVASFLAQGVGLLIFANLSTDRPWLVPFYYVIFGFGHAAFLVLQMPLIADYYGTRRFATVRGLTSMLQMPANVVARRCWRAGRSTRRAATARSSPSTRWPPPPARSEFR